MKLYHLDQFGAELRKIRTDCNLSQSDVYKAIGVSEDTLRRIEHGLVIPRLDTLEYLSALYKLDIGTLFLKSRLGHHYVHVNIAETLNNMIIHTNFEQIDQVIAFISETLESQDTRPTDQLFLNKLIQFKLMVEIIKSSTSPKKDAHYKDDLILKIESTLSLSIPDFSVLNVPGYNLDFIEIRLLIVYCDLLRLKDLFLDAIEILENLLEKTLYKMEFDKNHLDLLFKIYFNLAYCHHRNDNHEEVIINCDKGLELSRHHLNYSLMHAFLFRKSVSLFNLGNLSESEIVINDCITMLRVVGKESLANHYKKVFEDMYYNTTEKKRADNF
ncbi:MAG: helix-turn-helix domain-containing protein [Clostridiales bacterium]|nr:helix-turn-helix domain-containing protein [Clostridiales bacterium]